MTEFYPQIKWVHVAAAMTSATLFFLRGLAVQMNVGRPMAAPLRYLSYAVDTVLLIAALMLVTILPGAIFENGWLAMKLALVIGYIMLGSYALKRGSTSRVRLICFLAALCTFASIVGVARAHRPLGLLWGLDNLFRPRAW